MIVRGASCNSSKICRGTRALLNHKPFPVTGSHADWHTELLPVLMEHGSFEDQTASTFSLADEDHTLANSIRFSLNQDPRVTVCGYSIPHPADARVNIRVQTTGDPASEVFKDACQDLMLICQHVRSTFDQAIADFKKSQEIQGAEDLKTSQDLETMNIKD